MSLSESGRQIVNSNYKSNFTPDRFSKVLTSVLPYKFKINVFGKTVESIFHKVKGKLSPLSTSNFNEL